VTELLAAPPAPRFDGVDHDLSPHHYVPVPCVLHPEPVIEYPHPWDLPGALAKWAQRWDEEAGGLYWNQLSTTPDSKVGGHPQWIQDPQWPVCGCGRRAVTRRWPTASIAGELGVQPVTHRGRLDRHGLPRRRASVRPRRAIQRQTACWAAKRQARLVGLGFADVEGYLGVRRVQQGWSLRRMLAGLQVAPA
jgi:hypothetical protein